MTRSLFQTLNRRHMLAAAALGACLVSLHPSAAAQATFTVNLNADADTHVRTDLDDRRNDNYGRQQVLVVGTGRGGGGQAYGAADAMRSLVHFDLSRLPPSPLISAHLVMRIFQFNLGSPNAVFTVNAHRIVPSGARTPWIEGDGFEGWPNNAPVGSTDVNSAFGMAWAGLGDNADPAATNNTTQPDFDPAVESSVQIPRASTPPGAALRWNLTELVARWRNGEVPNLGVMLRDPTTAGEFRDLYLDAKDGADQPVPDVRWHAAPQLQLVFQAEPYSMADCKLDGWKRFPLLGFSNQGSCVSWVVTRHPPGKP